jgi:hypothetical protein
VPSEQRLTELGRNGSSTLAFFSPKLREGVPSIPILTRNEILSKGATINTTDAVLGGTVSNQSIVELPLNGRNFERLLDLRPGNVSTPGSGTGTSSANGRRTANNSMRVEGIVGMSNTGGSTILNASYRGGDSANLLPIDAIQEFNSAYNPKAEAGWQVRATGAGLAVRRLLYSSGGEWARRSGR